MIQTYFWSGDILIQDPDGKLTTEHVLYAIEDILGGHCAVANFVIRALIDVATRPSVQVRILTSDWLTQIIPSSDWFRTTSKQN